jgi:hypothetical protein
MCISDFCKPKATRSSKQQEDDCCDCVSAIHGWPLILLVDDDFLVREALRGVLNEPDDGATILKASQGRIFAPKSRKSCGVAGNATRFPAAKPPFGGSRVFLCNARPMRIGLKFKSHRGAG